MSAIRYAVNQGIATVNNQPDNMQRTVEVFGRGGNLRYLRLLGFICKPGAKHLPGGGFTTMYAVQVSKGDGSTQEEWVTLGTGETVECYWYPYYSYGSNHYGVYVVVDKEGLPIIVSRQGEDHEEATLTARFG